MFYSMLVLFHVATAVVGLLSGTLSMLARKGSGWHAAAGNIFVVSMLGMSSSAVYLAAVYHPIMINVVAGTLTFYLVTTSWQAAKYRDGRATAFHSAALLFVLAVALSSFSFGFTVAGQYGIPGAVYFVFGTVALLCAASDLRVLRQGGVSGPARLSRHLRMPLAFFVAVMSLYPGRAGLFPKWLRETKLLFVPHLLLIGAMLFWLVRLSKRKRMQRRTTEAVQTAPLAA
ncbi:MAG: hypothetical protein M3Q69_01120 [Acidobacteriota bacterium]|nr:hypothetical protein [Acidobacteriota bacterium]